MNINTKSKSPPDPVDLDLAVLEKLNSESRAFIESNDPAAIAALKTKVQLYQIALDNIAQGVCFFNGQQQLSLSNRRYAEMYHLKPEDISLGMTLREIIELRTTVGTNPAVSTEDYLSESTVINQTSELSTRNAKLADGREIAMWNQHMPDGGYVTTHDDITDGKNKSTSLQTLIDLLPDFLWVKDINSTFFLVNEATSE